MRRSMLPAIAILAAAALWSSAARCEEAVAPATAPAAAPAPATPASAPLPWGLMKPSLDVGLVITDEPKSRAFYGEVLGLQSSPTPLVLPTGAKMWRYQAGGSAIKLLLPPQPAPSGGPGGIDKAVGIRLVTLTMKDFEAISARAEAHGMKKPSSLGPAGHRVMFLRDPDDNQVELLELGADAPKPVGERFMIGLTVKNTDASRKFYGETLGLVDQGSGPLFGKTGPMKYNFGAGSTTIKFWQYEKELPVVTGGYDAAVGIRYFTFMTKDVDAAHEELVKRGAKIAQPPTNLGSIARVMFVEDPDGNQIEFAQVGGGRKKTE